MPRSKQRSSFDKVSEFDRERIVAYRECGIIFREIGSRVRRNQTTVIRICGCWMQEGRTDRRVRLHPPQCITSRDDRNIVCMAVTDRSVTSRTIAQHIQSIIHHPVSAPTIRCRLQHSGLFARCPLLRLPLTQNHKRLRRQWCDKRRMWTAEWNEIVFTDESHFCLQHHDGRIRVWRHRGERMLNSCVMHRHTGPGPAIMVWGGIRYHSSTPLAGIAVVISRNFTAQQYVDEVLRPVLLPFMSRHPGLTFQQDNARPHTAHVSTACLSTCRTLPCPARSPDLSPIEHVWSLVGRALQPARDVDDLTSQL
ncbi:Transposable element Tc1 transposase, partial [Stegodyphus mimosarum]